MTEPLSSDQIFIRKLTDIILANLGNENFGVKELARNAGISRSVLNRRLSKISGKTINQFIREVRLLQAMELLRTQELNAAEVSYKVGFSRPAYFNTCFSNYFGYPPGKVKKVLSENPEDYSITSFTDKQVLKNQLHKNPEYIKRGIIVFLIVLVLAVAFTYQKYFSQSTLDDLRTSDGKISVAVMPFQNMTDIKTWDAVQVNLISYLSSYEELRVREKEAIGTLAGNKGFRDLASITPEAASGISRKLNANVFVYGAINNAGSTVRLNAQLVNTKTKEVFKSFQINGPKEEESIFKIIDSLSVLVKNCLVKAKMENEVSPDSKPYKYTDSPEAYRNFILAEEATSRSDYNSALDLYTRSVAADSNFISAIIFLSMRYEDLGMLDDARKWCMKAYEKRDRINIKDRIMVNWYHATLFGTPDEEIKYLRQFIAVDDQVPMSYYQLGTAYQKIFKYKESIPEFEKALEIYKKWGIKPLMINNYSNLITSYHRTGQYGKEKGLLKKAEKDFPNKLYMLFWQNALLSFTIRDTISANRYIEKYISIMKDLSRTDVSVLTNVAALYWEAGILDKAEEYYSKALAMEPDDPVIRNNLANLLIDENLDVLKGLALIEPALELEPDNYILLDTKGWGLFKSGKSAEALIFLQKSWNLKPSYDHNLYLHLEEVKKMLHTENGPALLKMKG